MRDLEGLNSVVLGASAEGGSGWRAAERLVLRGSRVTVGARRIEGVNALAKKIGGASIRCDVASEADVEAMADLARRNGPIDLAILAAGHAPVGNIDRISGESLALAFDINFFGATYFIRHMARHLKDGGAIVMMTSLAATHPHPGYFSYACAAAAVHTLIKYAALEYAARGIRINAIAPGLIASPMAADLLSKPEAKKAMLREIPLGRAVEPTEIADTAIWIGTSGTAITGEWLYVDNGMHLRRPPQPEEIGEETLRDNAVAGGYQTT